MNKKEKELFKENKESYFNAVMQILKKPKLIAVVKVLTIILQGQCIIIQMLDERDKVKRSTKAKTK